MKRPAWLTNWHTDALVLLACCCASGALGGVIGALADRRFRP